MIEVIMPQVGQDIPTAKIIVWLKDVGDLIEKGDVIAEVESDKATFEVESEGEGTLLKILYSEDEDVEVFKPIAYIGQPGEVVPDRHEIKEDASTTASANLYSPQTVAAEVSTDSNRVAASPAAKRLARENGIDLKTVTGTGPGGRIVQGDIEDAIRDKGKVEESRFESFSSMRQAIADRMTHSKRDIPHFYLFTSIDMADAVAWRKRFKGNGEQAPTYTDLIVKACANALMKFPRLNSHVAANGLIPFPSANIGVAVAVDKGLLVPVIAEADRKSIKEIAAASSQNAEAARQGKIEAGPAATFTVTSLGMFGIGRFIPIINPPESCILAVGAIEKRVVPDENGDIVVREMMTVTLAADHRATDGVEAAQFLNCIKGSLENIKKSAGSCV